ncbi:MAG: 2-oxo acid dehydrogenase subunit E2 [Acidobacteria bacterium]|nr:2-oxo acid dehydrogenase subunit E2 [Acidobacteriota bacterium]
MAEETREFRLPDLGEGLTEAEIVSWRVKVGDRVALNQPLVEVETEKALVEIPSPFAGVVRTLHGAEGDRVEVGSVLVTFLAEAGAGSGPKRTEVLVGYGPEEGGGRRRRGPIGRRGAEAPAEVPPAPTADAPAGRAAALATPPVRKLARDLGVDIDSVRGTGPGGRVTREDVTAASKAPPAPAAAPPRAASPAGPRREGAAGPIEERIPVRAIRRSIAAKMVKSYTSIPHVTEWLAVDATDLMALRAELLRAPEVQASGLSPLAIVVKALTVALLHHPWVNSSWDEDSGEIVVKRAYHVGIASDTDRGLLVPVIRDADRLSIFELAAEIRRLVAAARDASIGPADLLGSTITVTNVGSFGMESGTPIINHPECAVLSLGAIVKRPWVVGGEILARDVVTLALTFDHRIVDGAEAGRFLRRLGDLVEHPARLLGML